jgi:glutathione S-transferase
MLRWAQEFSIPVPPELFGYFERVAERPAVRQALTEEGLTVPAAARADGSPRIELVAS